MILASLAACAGADDYDERGSTLEQESEFDERVSTSQQALNSNTFLGKHIIATEDLDRDKFGFDPFVIDEGRSTDPSLAFGTSSVESPLRQGTAGGCGTGGGVQAPSKRTRAKCQRMRRSAFVLSVRIHAYHGRIRRGYPAWKSGVS